MRERRRGRTAGGEKSEIARVVATLHRDEAYRLDYVDVRDPSDALGNLVRLRASLLAMAVSALRRIVRVSKKLLGMTLRSARHVDCEHEWRSCPGSATAFDFRQVRRRVLARD